MGYVRINAAGCNALSDYVIDRFEVIPQAQLRDAQRFAPVLTGQLKLSGRVQKVGRSRWSIIFGTGLPDGRAVYNERGTVHMAAQPYIRPAMYMQRAV